MRVAKASPADIDAALELLGFLDCIAKGYYPTLPGEEVDDDMQMYVDEDDPDHLRHVWRSLRKILDKAPGFQGRVLFGFATIADPRNKILNPDADCIELHPRFAETPHGRLEDALQVLRMVDTNDRVRNGERRKAWDGKFVIEEVRRVLAAGGS